MRAGQRIRVGIVRQGMGTGRVDEVTAVEVRLTIDAPETATEPPPVSLVLALPRPKVLSRVLQSAAALGVERVDIVNAWRVEKSYFGSPRLDPARLIEDLWLGCEQGVATWLPEIQIHRRFRPFVEDELPRRLAERRALALVAHPHDAERNEWVGARGSRENVVAAIGPEGGWTDAELTSFEQIGAARFRISDRVLRVESAVVAVLAQLELLRRLG